MLCPAYMSYLVLEQASWDANEEGRRGKRTAAVFLCSGRFFYLFICESFSSIFVATYHCINSNFFNSRVAICCSMLRATTEMVHIHATVCPAPTELDTKSSGTVIHTEEDTACILLFANIDTKLHLSIHSFS